MGLLEDGAKELPIGHVFWVYDTSPDHMMYDQFLQTSHRLDIQDNEPVEVVHLKVPNTRHQCMVA
jgi:hypothetical protein